MNLTLGYAAAAGLCAAIASVCAKLAMTAETVLHLCKNVTAELELPAAWQCERVVLYLRIVLFAMIFLFNGIMWTLFVKSLQQNSSSLQPTATNTASNFCFTALFGFVLFGESMSLMWYVGATIVVIGLVLVNQGTSEINEDTSKHKQTVQGSKKDR